MYCQLLGHKGVAFGSIGFWNVWLKHLKNYVTMQCNVLVLNTSRSRQQNAPEEPQWDCGRYMGPPMVHLDSLTGSQLFWSECQPGCVQARRLQSKRAGLGPQGTKWVTNLRHSFWNWNEQPTGSLWWCVNQQRNDNEKTESGSGI